ncbi:hypothetical protein [Leptolyngbya sp. CCY15150]|nr:hypothetical protein [Leptolyngbya sp. CCY15150]
MLLSTLLRSVVAQWSGGSGRLSPTIVCHRAAANSAVRRSPP